MPRKKTSEQLTKREMIFVACYAGNQVEAARLAGFKDPKKNASAIYNRPRVRAAIEKKQNAIVKAAGEKLGKAISVTPNDIVNRLDDLSQDAENDSTKVSALSLLADIFGIKAKDAKSDPFGGWTDEEIAEFARTGKRPKRLIEADN